VSALVSRVVELIVDFSAAGSGPFDQDQARSAGRGKRRGHRLPHLVWPAGPRLVAAVRLCRSPVLASLVVTQVLARGMTAPMRQMTAAAREMAAGRRATAIRATSRDEVGELARAFTAMARDLETADVQRRELLANVGHELRTPVAALRAQLENLVDGVRRADPPALGEVLDQVQRLGSSLTICWIWLGPRRG